MTAPSRGVLTHRLELRLPVEADRSRFVELFQDPAFMEFSAGVHDVASAHARFDDMLRTADELPFGKQPIVERSSGRIVGYSGVAWFAFDGTTRLEFGYRLTPEARGVGYATEAGRAVLSVAARSFRGELLAMIDPRNVASKRVIDKLGFDFWKLAEVNGFRDELYRRRFQEEAVLWVRRAHTADAPAVRAVVERAIRGSSRDLYSGAQIEAWASGGSLEGVAAMIETTVAFVAVSSGRVVGFGNLDGADVDQLYVDPDMDGRGVARELYQAIEHEARAGGVATLTATASLRAVPAFERFGFADRAQAQRAFNGATFEVAQMAKELRPDG
jgi:RimJ/RimL family protein N-acetyltransferase/predicted N-acetyltransferase YhbS